MISICFTKLQQKLRAVEQMQDLTNVARLMQQELDVKDRLVPYNFLVNSQPGIKAGKH